MEPTTIQEDEVNEASEEIAGGNATIPNVQEIDEPTFFNGSIRNQSPQDDEGKSEVAPVDLEPENPSHDATATEPPNRNESTVDDSYEPLLPEVDQDSENKFAAVAPNQLVESTSPPPLSVEGESPKFAAPTEESNPASEKIAEFKQWHSKLLNRPPPTDEKSGVRRKRPAAKTFLQNMKGGLNKGDVQGIVLNSTNLAQLDNDDFPIAFAYHQLDPESKKRALERQDELDMLTVGRKNKSHRNQMANVGEGAADANTKKGKRKTDGAEAPARKPKKSKVVHSVLENLPVYQDGNDKRSSLESLPFSAKQPKSKSGTPRRKSEGAGIARSKALEIWSGPPDEPLAGGWPEGWVKKLFQRASGESKGHTDRYWYSPVQNYKFRSMTEIKRFFEAMANTNNDEVAAWRLFKAK